MPYKIESAYTAGGQLTMAQKTSSKFAFTGEPKVLGRVLRRGSKPFIITDDLFGIHQDELHHLEKSGTIILTQVSSMEEEASTQPPPPEMPQPPEVPLIPIGESPTLPPPVVPSTPGASDVPPVAPPPEPPPEPHNAPSAPPAPPAPQVKKKYPHS